MLELIKSFLAILRIRTAIYELTHSEGSTNVSVMFRGVFCNDEMSEYAQAHCKGLGLVPVETTLLRIEQ